MDGQHVTESAHNTPDVFAKVKLSNEIRLLIESEQPDKILTYILTNMDIMRQQLSILMPIVSEINREAKKTNGKIIKLQEWKDEYEHLLPETILSVQDHDKLLKSHAEKITDMEGKVEVHHSALVKTSTIGDFIAKAAVFVVAAVTTAAALVEIFK